MPRFSDSPGSLTHYLEAADGAGKLMAHARLLLRLGRAYREIAPAHLHQASVLANYKKTGRANDSGNSTANSGNPDRPKGIVVIHAHSGAIAAKLRQIAPRLAEGFCKSGVECSEVRVKVQAPAAASARREARQKPLGANAFHALAGLRDALPAGGELQRSLSGLLSRCALKDEHVHATGHGTERQAAEDSSRYAHGGAAQHASHACR